LVEGMQLPRQKAKDGKGGHHPFTASLKARVEVLEAELAKVEVLAGVLMKDEKAPLGFTRTPERLLFLRS
jgi:hypothetical protein